MGILGSGSVHNQGRRGPRGLAKRTDALNVTCQKCLQKGHYTYECKNPPAYVARPSRTQQLFNGKARPRFLDKSELPAELESAGRPSWLDRGAAPEDKAAAAKKSTVKPRKQRKRRSSSSSSSDSSSGSSSSSSSGSDDSSGSSSSSGTSSTGGSSTTSSSGTSDTSGSSSSSGSDSSGTDSSSDSSSSGSGSSSSQSGSGSDSSGSSSSGAPSKRPKRKRASEDAKLMALQSKDSPPAARGRSQRQRSADDDQAVHTAGGDRLHVEKTGLGGRDTQKRKGGASPLRNGSGSIPEQDVLGGRSDSPGQQQEGKRSPKRHRRSRSPLHLVSKGRREAQARAGAARGVADDRWEMGAARQLGQQAPEEEPLRHRAGPTQRVAEQFHSEPSSMHDARDSTERGLGTNGVDKPGPARGGPTHHAVGLLDDRWQMDGSVSPRSPQVEGSNPERYKERHEGRRSRHRSDSAGQARVRAPERGRHDDGNHGDGSGERVHRGGRGRRDGRRIRVSDARHDAQSPAHKRVKQRSLSPSGSSDSRSGSASTSS